MEKNVEQISPTYSLEVERAWAYLAQAVRDGVIEPYFIEPGLIEPKFIEPELIEPVLIVPKLL